MKLIAALMFGLLATTGSFCSEKAVIVSRAEHMFGPTLNADHEVFALDDTYVAWLLFDRFDNLEIEVGNKYDFPRLKPPAPPHYLSEPDFEGMLARLSSLKELGPLRQKLTRL